MSPRQLSVVTLVALATTASLRGQDLCQALVRDKLPHPVSNLAKPALGKVAVDPDFGTRLRRISSVTARSGVDPAIRPLYSTTAAWNADESLLLLYEVGRGHRLHDGWTYAFIRYLDIAPADLEQVYWDDDDPGILYYVEGKTLIRYHVLSGAKEQRHRFDFCQGSVRADSHAFTSWSSDVIGLGCDGKVFMYDQARDLVTGIGSSPAQPPMAAASGKRSYFHGYVLNESLGLERALDIAEPDTHLSLGLDGQGRDVLNGAMYDPGPRGSGVGSLVSFDLANGSSRVVIGPDTGYPYPPSGTHVSSLVRDNPGWVFVSIIGEPTRGGVLDSELLLANVDTGVVCRIGRHRSWGKNNTRLAVPYWAEPHVSASPSGTRALFASDWGNGASVDAYVVELPSYAPPTPGLSMTLAPDQAVHRVGEQLALSLTLANVGATPNADLYFLVVLPDARMLVFQNWYFASSEVATSDPSTWPAIASDVALPYSFTAELPAFFTANLTGSLPIGEYLFAFLAIRSGSFDDNRVDPGDLLASSIARFELKR